MKVSSSALAMLLREYKAILNNSYLKNISVGLLLGTTLALTSTSANAATDWTNNVTEPVEITAKENFKVTGDATISGKGAVTVKAANALALQSAHNLTIGKPEAAQVALTLSGAATDKLASVEFANIIQDAGKIALQGNASLIATGNLNIKNGAELNITNAANTVKANTADLNGTINVAKSAALTLTSTNTALDAIKGTGTIANSGSVTFIGNADLTKAKLTAGEAGAAIIINDTKTNKSNVKVSNTNFNSYLNEGAKGSFVLNESGTLSVVGNSVTIDEAKFQNASGAGNLVVKAGSHLDLTGVGTTTITTQNTNSYYIQNIGGKVSFGDVKFDVKTAGKHIAISGGTIDFNGNITVNKGKNLRAFGNDTLTTIFNFNGSETGAPSKIISSTDTSLIATHDQTLTRNDPSAILNFKGQWDLGTSDIIAERNGLATIYDKAKINGTGFLYIESVKGTGKINGANYATDTDPFGSIDIQAGANVTMGGIQKLISKADATIYGDLKPDASDNASIALPAAQNGGKLTIAGSLTLVGDGKEEALGNEPVANKFFAHDIVIHGLNVDITSTGKLALTTKDVVEDVVFNVDKVKADTSIQSNNFLAIMQNDKNKDYKWLVNKLSWSDSVNVAAGGELFIDLSKVGVNKLTLAEAQNLRDNLMTAGSQGSLNFGDNISIDLGNNNEIIKPDNTVNVDDLAGLDGIKNLVIPGLDKVTVTGIDSNPRLPGSTYGEFQVNNGVKDVNLSTGDYVLTNGSHGFVYSKDASGNTTAVDVSIGNASSLTLKGAGSAGNISGTGGKFIANAVGGNISVGTIKGLKNVTTAGTVTTKDIAVTDLAVNGKLTTVGVEQNSGTISVASLSVAQGASVNTDVLNISGDAKVKGSLVNGNVNVKELNLSNATVLNIGSEGANSATGSVQVDKLALNGGTIVIDPEYGQRYASLAYTNNTSGTNGVIALDGGIVVAKNGASILGGNEQNLRAVLVDEDLLDRSNSLSPEQGAVLVVNHKVDLTNGSIAVGADTAAMKSATSDLTLGKGGTILITSNALKGTINVSKPSVPDTGDKKEVATKDVASSTQNSVFYFGANGGVVNLANGQEKEQLSRIMLRYDLKQGTTVNLFGNAKVTTPQDGFIVETGNPFINLEIKNGSNGTGVAVFNEAAIDELYAMSYPIVDALEDIARNGYNGRGAGYDFLMSTATFEDGGKTVNTAAQLAVFGGVYQGALSATRSSTRAMEERTNIGAINSIAQSAELAQGFSMWLNPVYSRVDASGFNADGISYGADVDLYGLSLGADFTSASGFKLGAMFNVGSGDADGSGNASYAKNDFDYYGFGLYTGYSMGALSLGADFSYTVLDNDLTQSTNGSSYGQLKATTDASVLSLGLGGKYTVDMGTVSVAPHAALRFSSIDVDDYTVSSDYNDLVNTAMDKLNIFSIPVGVTISGNIQAGSFTVSPFADVTLSFNAGDTEANFVSEYIGYEDIGIKDEIMDKFTYGLSAGVNATNGNLGLFINADYVGSSNQNEFGLRAGAKYTF